MRWNPFTPCWRKAKPASRPRGKAWPTRTPTTASTSAPGKNLRPLPRRMRPKHPQARMRRPRRNSACRCWRTSSSPAREQNPGPNPCRCSPNLLCARKTRTAPTNHRRRRRWFVGAVRVFLAQRRFGEQRQGFGPGFCSRAGDDDVLQHRHAEFLRGRRIRACGCLGRILRGSGRRFFPGAEVLAVVGVRVGQAFPRGLEAGFAFLQQGVNGFQRIDQGFLGCLHFAQLLFLVDAPAHGISPPVRGSAVRSRARGRSGSVRVPAGAAVPRRRRFPPPARNG